MTSQATARLADLAKCATVCRATVTETILGTVCSYNPRTGRFSIGKSTTASITEAARRMGA